MVLTDSAEHASYRLAVFVDNYFVLAKHTGTNTLDNTNLGSLLVLKLSQTEGEGTELFNDLGQKAARCRALELVSKGGTSVQCGPVAVVLDLAASERKTNLNTPDLANLGKTLTTYTLAGRKDNLLLGLDLVVLELPDGSALDNVAAVGLGDLLEHLGHLGLCVGLAGSILLLLLFIAVRDKTGWDHQPQKKLVCVVCSCQKIRSLASDLANDDVVADNGSEAIDLSTELDLNDLAGLQRGGRLLTIGLERSVRCDVRAGRNGGAVTNALGDLLSPVDLADLLFEELVTALAELNNAGALRDPSCKSQYSSLRVTRSSQRSARGFEASLRTGDFLKDLLGDVGGDLVLGQGVRVRERVVCCGQ